MLGLALMLMSQEIRPLVDTPQAAPGVCSVAPLYVDAISDSFDLQRGPYMTAAQAEAGEKRRTDLQALAATLRARFGKIRAKPEDISIFSSLTAEQMLALARACIALPK